ncbi:unnamed protein product [Cochlearia groenlandica]
MDSFTTHKSKPRKTKKLARKSRFRIIFDMFSRAIEIIAVLVTIGKLSYQLVIAFEDYDVVAVILANRNLAFAVGNAIVIALIAKSGLLSNQELDSKRKSNGLYEEFARESSSRDVISRTHLRNIREERGTKTEKQSITENMTKQSKTEKKTKQSKLEKMSKQSITENGEKKQSIVVKMEEQSIKEEKKKKKQSIVENQDITDNMQIQTYKRSMSENLEEEKKKCCERLRRSETNVSNEIFETEDELRYKIESFIARQRRNQNYD